ncbi:MAG: LemA family protein [Planctomycetaceae bacterium]|nr:LemA family protein [Planctomycetaceae bacterium]
MHLTIASHDPAQLIPPAVGGALALLCVWAAVRASRMRRFIDDMPTSKTAGVFIGDVELKGTAETSQPFTTYLWGGKCVLYSWTVGEHWSRTVIETYTDSKGRTQTRTRRESGVTTVASGGESAPFYLLDDTGHLLIRPEGANLEPRTVFSRTVGRGDSLYYGKGPPGAVSNSDHRRTFTEVAIPMHEPIFVMGMARERKDAVAAEIAHSADQVHFLISVRDEKAISGGYAWGTWLWAIFGFILFVVGVVIAERNGRFVQETSIAIYVAAVVAFLGVYLIAWSLTVFNSILRLRQRARRAWSNIDVELKRRHDLIPRLAECVKGYAMHERDTQQVVTLLRSQYALSPEEARGREAKVIGLSPAMVAVAEAYPDLKASESFLALQRELAVTESRIAMARTYYNGVATAFNGRLAVVPDAWLAAIARLKAFELFEAKGLERQSVAVDFAQ